MSETPVDASSPNSEGESLRSKATIVRLRMETACVAFLQATEESAWAWLLGRAEEAVAAQADAARPAVVQKLRRLRSHREGLVARIRELVARHVNQDRFWTHRCDGVDHRTETANPYAVGDGRKIAVLEPPLAELLRHVDALLWRYDLARSDADTANRTVQLWSGDMRTTIDRYARLHDILEELRQALTTRDPH